MMIKCPKCNDTGHWIDIPDGLGSVVCACHQEEIARQKRNEEARQIVREFFEWDGIQESKFRLAEWEREPAK